MEVVLSPKSHNQLTDPVDMSWKFTVNDDWQLADEGAVKSATGGGATVTTWLVESLQLPK